jgi:integrase
MSLLPALSPAAAKALDVSPAEIIKRWLASVSKSAERSYARALRSFTAWAMPGEAEPQRGLQLLCEANSGGAHELLIAWRDQQLERLAPGTVSGNLSAISSLMRCCRRAGLVSYTIEGIAPKRERVEDRRGPGRGDIERLVAYVDDLASVGKRQAVRDAAIIRLLYVGAMRRAEVVGLRLEDVDLYWTDGPTVYPRRKGFRTRQPLLVSQRTAEALAAWLEIRGDGPGYLFHRLDRSGHLDQMAGESIRQLLKRYADLAGLKGPCRPHGLRHSSATEIAKRGSLDELMALGSWKSLSAASSCLDKRSETRQRALVLVDL